MKTTAILALCLIYAAGFTGAYIAHVAKNERIANLNMRTPRAIWFALFWPLRIIAKAIKRSF